MIVGSCMQFAGYRLESISNKIVRESDLTLVVLPLVLSIKHFQSIASWLTTLSEQGSDEKNGKVTDPLLDCHKRPWFGRSVARSMV